MRKQFIWKLKPGNMDGQETADEKLAAGMNYVEMLKSMGDEIVSVENKETYLKIITEDNV